MSVIKSDLIEMLRDVKDCNSTSYNRKKSFSYFISTNTNLIIRKKGELDIQVQGLINERFDSKGISYTFDDTIIQYKCFSTST